MNLEILVHKDTCFYYWVQVMACWSSHGGELELLRYYEKIGITFSKEEEIALGKIKRILKDAKKPRGILVELYSNEVKTSEAEAIAQYAHLLRSQFEPIWQASVSHLERSAEKLQATDFTRFTAPMSKIAHFLDADFDLQTTYTIYLLPNPMRSWAAGQVINKTHFMFVRPSANGSPTEVNDTISTIAHEYVHCIQFNSKTSTDVLKESYEHHIGSRRLAPSGFTWKDMYVEALMYCFASKRIRGYLSEEIYGKPSVTLHEMQGKFHDTVKQNKHTVYHIMNWAALNILPDVEAYIEKGQKIDRRIADKLSKIFLKFA